MDALRELKGLQERIKVLEHDLRERDRLIESLGKEGTSMYHTMRMVEDHLLVDVYKRQLLFCVSCVFCDISSILVPRDRKYVEGE